MSAMHPVFGFVSASDRRISSQVLRWRPPRWFRVWMLSATRLGDGWIWYAIALALLGGGSAYHNALAKGALAAGVASVAQSLLKRRFRRPRPCELAPNPLYAVRPPDRFSFPSGHSMNAFAIASVLAAHFPFAAPALGFLAASVAASRVLLGLHYVSDVVVGAMLGLGIGGAVLVVLHG